ncbi:MAG: helix-turn-helix domain-containing protein [Calothrix sp. FI2-JRJ7]|nr:helix-turn-helix domain-containing protein [Calothrix sp. FI2-JRJ7]
MREATVLRIIMSEFHISGAELSRQSGVSYQQISKFRGGNEISRANFVKIVNALPEQARRWYLSLVFNVTLDSEPSFKLKTLKLKFHLEQLLKQLGVEISESPPTESTDDIAVLQEQIDELKEMLSQLKNQDLF